MGHTYRKLYPHCHRDQLLACITYGITIDSIPYLWYNADVTRVLKQAKRSFT